MSIIKFFQSFSNPFLDNFFQVITATGEETTIIFVMLILYWCIDKKSAIKLGFIQLFSAVTNGAIKDLVNESRPIGQPGIFSLRVETATGSSFPSGHTQGAATFWTSIMSIYKKRWIYIVGSLLIILVGISRLYCGVHWPQDVLAGVFFGILSMLIGSIIVDAMYKKTNYMYMFFLILPAVAGMAFFHSEDYIKAVALSLGFYLGFIIEDSYIRFSPEGTARKHIMKLLIGIIGLLIIKLGLKLILGETNLSVFTSHFLIGLWAVAIAPLIFIKLKLSHHL